MIRPVALASLAVCAVAIAGGCGKSPTTPTTGSGVSGFVTGVSTTDAAPVQASAQSGTVPSPSGGPASTITGNGTAVNGGASLVGVSSTAPFQSVIVSVGGVSGSSGVLASGFGFGRTAATTTSPTTDGYYRLNLPAAVTSESLVMTFARTISAAAFNLQVQVVAPGGAVGPVATLPVTVQTVSSASLQISVSWNQPSDLDLHVVEPSGFEIFYAQPDSTTGGTLDLDSNPSCDIDNIDNEDVGWPTGAPTNGTYTVRVDYFSACRVAKTDYVVTVTNNGSVKTFVGSFLPQDADEGSSGSGRTITTFTYAASRDVVPSLLPLLTRPLRTKR